MKGIANPDVTYQLMNSQKCLIVLPKRVMRTGREEYRL